jgi:hypothetical protein
MIRIIKAVLDGRECSLNCRDRDLYEYMKEWAAGNVPRYYGELFDQVPKPEGTTSMTAAEFAKLVEGAKRPTGSRQWWSAYCPAHEDSSPSLGFKDGDKGLVVKCQAGCQPEQIAEAVGRKIADFFETKPEKVKMLRPLTVEALAKAKGFEVDFLKSLGVVQDGDYVKITHRLTDGSLAARHLRVKLRSAATR